MRSDSGRISRQIDETLGDGVAETLVLASGGYHHPTPVPGLHGFMVDGDFYPTMAGGGWSDVSDVLTEAATNGKLQRLQFAKTDSNNTALTAADPWQNGGFPNAGTAAVLPGGTALDNTSVGGMPFRPALSGDRLHFLGARAGSSNAATLILVDMLWRGQIAGNSAAAQTITGVPTRYQGTDAAGVVTGLSISSGPAATAHNHTFKYVDEQGNAVETSPATPGLAGGANTRIDVANNGQWFNLLNAGDMGLRKLTEYTMSAAVATGGWQIWIAKPLAFIPCWSGGLLGGGDSIATGFNMVEIKDTACLSMFMIHGQNNGNNIAAEIFVGGG